VVGIYCRVSSVGQQDNYSLGIQEQYGTSFAKSIQDGHLLYKETGSGASIARPELEKLLNDIKRGIIDKVWVIEFTRLSRSVEDLQIIKNIFNQHKTRLFVNGQELDINRPADVLMYNIYGAFAEHERSNMLERVQRGTKKSIDSGNGACSYVYGYTHKYKEDGTRYWEINQEEAAVVRLVFRKYLDGMSQRQIAHLLNSDHCRTKMNRAWSQAQVSRIVNQLFYIGKTRNTSGEIIESNRFPPLIDSETFQTARRTALINDKTKISLSKAGVKNVIYNSSGLAKCPECGVGFYHVRNSRGVRKSLEYNRYYKARHKQGCKNRSRSIRKKLLDDIVFYTTMELFENWQDVQSLYEQQMDLLEERSQQDKARIESLENQKASLERKKERLIQAVADGVFEVSETQKQMDTIRAELTEISDIILRLNNSRQSMKQEWDYILAKFSHERREDLMVKYCLDEDETEVNKIFRDVIRRSWLKDNILTLEYITGKHLSINTVGLPD
jgi:site-specific DNA recombinase